MHHSDARGSKPGETAQAPARYRIDSREALRILRDPHALLPLDGRLDGKPGWLREGHADDTLIASTLDIAVADLRAEVVLVTRDRNVHNKARLAGLQSAPVAGYAPQA